MAPPAGPSCRAKSAMPHKLLLRCFSGLGPAAAWALVGIDQHAHDRTLPSGGGSTLPRRRRGLDGLCKRKADLVCGLLVECAKHPSRQWPLLPVAIRAHAEFLS